MTLGRLRDFFRTRLDGLGYHEWTDGFNIDNIPSTVLDKSYHLEVGEITSGPANQSAHIFQAPIKVRIFSKGFRDPSAAIDEILDSGQSIMADFLSSPVRNGQDDLKDISPVLLRTLPLDVSNDNAVILEMEFNCYLTYCF